MSDIQDKSTGAGPQPLEPEVIGPILDAIVLAEPMAKSEIENAVHTGAGMAGQFVAQPWFNGVDILWVVLGSGPAAFVRYLAVYDNGDIEPLTESPENFSAMAQAQPVSLTQNDVLNYALLYHEVTRSMDVVSQLLQLESSEHQDAWRQMVLNDVFGTDGGLSIEQRIEVFSRLSRWRAVGPDSTGDYRALRRILTAYRTGNITFDDDAIYAQLQAEGFSPADLRQLEMLRRLPVSSLSAEEANVLVRARRAFQGGVDGRVFALLSESQVFGDGGFITSREDGLPTQRQGKAVTYWGGPVRDQRCLVMHRNVDTGEIQAIDESFGLLLSMHCEPDSLQPIGADVDASLSAEAFVTMQGGTPYQPMLSDNADWLVAKNGQPLNFDEASALYEIDGQGKAVCIWMYSPEGQQWVLPQNSGKAHVTNDSSNGHFEPSICKALSVLLALDKPGPVITSVVDGWRVDILLEEGNDIVLSQLTVGIDGRVYDERTRIV